MSPIVINQSLSLAELMQDQLTLNEVTELIHLSGKINTEALHQLLNPLPNSSLLNPSVDKIATAINEENQPLPCLQIGVDEAGRGPLLGSVVIGAVLLPAHLTGELAALKLEDSVLSQLNDSKKISEKKRNAIYQQLQRHAVAYLSVDVPASIIDEINILQASLQGMRLAVRTLLKEIAQCITDIGDTCTEVSNANNIEANQTASDITPDISSLNVELLFDGNKLPPLDFSLYQQWGYSAGNIKASSVVKGDAKFSSIASASVVAKVERDEQMYQLAKQYPQYGIEKHKGYPTKVHLLALEKFGATKTHRSSFAPVRNLRRIDER